MTRTSARIKPSYCHYVRGACDKRFDDAIDSRAFFVFPSEPKTIASTVHNATRTRHTGGANWYSWKDLNIAGRPIFCTICKALRFADNVVADVTTLNFNVLFEIGYAWGLGIPVIPVRDSSYERDASLFDELGLLDTIGYVDFDTSETLAKTVAKRVDQADAPSADAQRFEDTPMYMLAPSRPSDGSTAFTSVIKKSRIGYRSYDRDELPRLSLHEAEHQLGGSLGLFAYLMDPARSEAIPHNARAAFLAGMALARGQVVALIQENTAVRQPIDYRDLIKGHDLASEVEPLLRDPIQALALISVQRRDSGLRTKGTRPLLERIDLGDLAAENEIRALNEYFVSTGQSALALKGHARMVIGRKGTGKTAIFYAVREHAWNTPNNVVLDLKPESHQFATLRDFIRDRMPDGLALHTMVAFWNYLLLCELARKTLRLDEKNAARDPKRYELYQRMSAAYEKHDPGPDADFSQRLRLLVNRVVEGLDRHTLDEIGSHLTELIFMGDMRELRESIMEYIAQEKDSVWLLVDNLDKGLPTRGAAPHDILIVMGLLEATRKLQRQVEDEDVDFHCLIFLRNDVYEQLLRQTVDKGKDTAIALDWDDPESFAWIVRKRIETSTELSGRFRDAIWPNIAETHVGTQDSFDWMLDRTLMRPRDLLFFLREAIAVAINRGHNHIRVEDMLHAETGYSDEQLLTLSFELQQVAPEFGDVVFSFQGIGPIITPEQLDELFRGIGLSGELAQRARDLLMWYGFLGVHSEVLREDAYSHKLAYNLRRMLMPIDSGNGAYVIHPMFQKALSAG